MPRLDRNSFARRRLAAATPIVALAVAAAGPRARGVVAGPGPPEPDRRQAVRALGGAGPEGRADDEIAPVRGKIEQLAGEVAVLRTARRWSRHELKAKQEELDTRADALRGAARSPASVAQACSRNRLVGIYKSGTPDLLTVLLDSNGFDDLVARAEYLQRIEQDEAESSTACARCATTPRHTVLHGPRAARDAIAAKEAELRAHAGSLLRTRRRELQAARDHRQELLASDRERTADDARGRPRQRSRTRSPQQLSGGVDAAPGGPDQQGLRGSSSGRSTARSSPASAAAGAACTRASTSRVPEGPRSAPPPSGTVVFISRRHSGGYGNYTCIDHGGGLSTCYAHQSRFSTSVGRERQPGRGDRLLGCTGSASGPHLHFEVRVNGAPSTRWATSRPSRHEERRTAPRVG